MNAKTYNATVAQAKIERAETLKAFFVSLFSRKTTGFAKA